MRERGIDFEFASRVFDSNYIEGEDHRRDYKEIRHLVVGEVEGELITVAWTPRGRRRRIIAAWPSSNQERRKYYEHYPKEES